jgi:hypothetical protein
MNYYALSAVGPDHDYIEDELIDEMSNRPAVGDLPHFAPVLASIGGRPRVNGVWEYYTRIVTDNPGASPHFDRP